MLTTVAVLALVSLAVVYLVADVNAPGRQSVTRAVPGDDEQSSPATPTAAPRALPTTGATRRSSRCRASAAGARGRDPTCAR